MKDPLKQGLKQSDATSNTASIRGWSERSIKTRIETIPPLDAQGKSSGVEVKDPLKQGLKQLLAHQNQLLTSMLKWKIH